jgi:voltage-gated potassium channel
MPISRTKSRAPGALRAFDRPIGVDEKRLFVGGHATVKRTLAVRAALVLAMFFAVVLVFWFDRDGLRDNHDGVVSFVDIVYFSMVTVTTVGYGDIVPVTVKARLIDAIFVTPIRLFIWLIFLGTAYQLVLQRFVEDIRMRIMQARLKNHVVVCGFGHAGRSAAAELVRRGNEPRNVLVIDPSREIIEAASEAGYVGLLGDATHEQVLREAMIDSASAVFVCVGRDDTGVLVVLTVRHLFPNVRIVAIVQEDENEKLLRQSGADATVMPAKVGGILLADSLATSNLAGYVMELITYGGRVTLTEREAAADEVGLAPRDIRDGLVVRVLRGSEPHGFWEPGVQIERGDRLVVIQHEDSQRA